MWSNLTKKLKDFAEELAYPELDEEEEEEIKDNIDENENDETDELHENQYQHHSTYHESNKYVAKPTVAQWNDIYGNLSDKSSVENNVTEASLRNVNNNNNNGFIREEENLFERAKRLWEVANTDNNTQLQTSEPTLPPTSVQAQYCNELGETPANDEQSPFHEQECCEVINSSNNHCNSEGVNHNMENVKWTNERKSIVKQTMNNEFKGSNNKYNSTKEPYYYNNKVIESNSEHNESSSTPEEEEQEIYKEHVDHAIPDEDANSLLAFTFPAQVNSNSNDVQCVKSSNYPPLAQDENEHQRYHEEEEEEEIQENVTELHRESQQETGNANKLWTPHDSKQKSLNLTNHANINTINYKVESKEERPRESLEMTSKITHELHGIKNVNEYVERVMKMITQEYFVREEEFMESIALRESLLIEEKKTFYQIKARQIDARWRERVTELEKQLSNYQEANDELRSNYEASERELLNARQSVQEWQAKVTSMMEEIEELQQEHDVQERERRQQEQVEMERIIKLEEANTLLQRTCQELEKKLSRYCHDSKDQNEQTSEEANIVNKESAIADGNSNNNNNEEIAANANNSTNKRKASASSMMKSMSIIKEAEQLLVTNLIKYKIRYDEPDHATTRSEEMQEEEEEEEQYEEESISKHLLYLVNVTLSEFVKARTAYLTALNVQSQWEQTYEQAKNVNSTLNSDLNAAHATIDMLTNEAAMKEEAVAMLTSQLNSAEELLSFEREKNETNEDKLVSAINESGKWRSRVEELTEMNNELRIQLNHISVEHEESEHVLAQKERELRELKVNNNNLQNVLNSLKEQRTESIRVNAANMYKEIDQLRNELSTLKQERQEHAIVVDSLKAKHSKEMTAKNAELAGLYRKHAELRKALDFSAKQLNGETMIDKSVISHLLVNFIHAFVLGAIVDNNKSEVENKRREADEMLKVLSGLLNWDEVMQEKAGLLPGKLNPKPLQWQSKSNNRHKLKMLTSLLSRSSSKRLTQEQKQGHERNDNDMLERSVSNVSVDSEGDNSNRSLAALWVDFLLKESERHVTEVNDNSNSVCESQTLSVDAITNNDDKVINTQTTSVVNVADSAVA